MLDVVNLISTQNVSFLGLDETGSVALQWVIYFPRILEAAEFGGEIFYSIRALPPE